VKAVFGLGNPGRRYAASRHNVGFQLVDLYRSSCCPRVRGRLRHSALLYSCGGILLVKPMTFMNASGIAVRRVLDAEGIPLKSALVIYDDLDLPLGSLRIRPQGGPASHNGMGSVVAELRSEAIPRLRIGIGIADRTQAGRDYVLDRLSETDRATLRPALERAVEAIAMFEHEDLDAVMTRFNRVEP
jgi:PTH1 family peptidyl-tRNA hydrolase